MGTSTSYSGPTGSNPLIPPWANPGDAIETDSGEADPSPTNPVNPNENTQAAPPTFNSPNILPLTPWRNVKVSFTRFASNTYSSPIKARKVTRSFVKAQGGAKNAATNSTHGRSAVQNIGSIFSGLAQQGSSFVYKGFSFKECIGKRTSELLNIFVDLVIDENNDLESMVARNATVETFNQIFELLEVNDKGFDALQNLDIESIKVIFQTYLSEYISTSLIQKTGQILEKLPAQEAYQKERWIKNFIKTKVTLSFSSIDVLSVDWKGKQGKDFVQDIFTQAFKLIE